MVHTKPVTRERAFVEAGALSGSVRFPAAVPTANAVPFGQPYAVTQTTNAQGHVSMPDCALTKYIQLSPAVEKAVFAA